MRMTAALMTLIFVSPTLAEDWPTFLGPRRNGTSSEPGLAKRWPDAGPRKLWSIEVGEGFSGPVAQGEHVLLHHRRGDDEILECFDLQGRSRWQLKSPSGYEDALGKGNGPRSTPTVADGKVYALGAEGLLTCAELASGKKLWQRALHRDYQVPRSYFGVGTSPLVHAGLVLVNVGAKNAGVVGLKADTGVEAWKASSDGASYSSPTLAQVGGETLAVFFTRQGVLVLEARTGKVRHQQRWRARYDASVNAATPLVVDDLAFFSSCYETGALLLRLKKDSAQELWSSDEAMSNHYNTCVVHEGHLYGFHGRQEAGPDFRCVDLRSGKVAWEKAAFGCGNIVLVDQRLLVVTEQGELLWVSASPKGYQEQARARISDAAPLRAQPALASGRLLVRDAARLMCLDLRD